MLGAKYCDERDCMSVYMSARLHISNKSSAVADMGDRGHNRHGPKRGGGGAVVPLSRELGLRLVQCGLGRGLLPYQVASHPSSHLATIDIGQKLSGVGVPFFWG